jgi:phosphoserine aminotransferase
MAVFFGQLSQEEIIDQMRKHNFYAGPSTLPVPVLEELRDQMVDYDGMGLSLVETSHRSKEYDAVHNAALAGLREHMQLSSDYDILLLGGGATLQFAMIPMNILNEGDHADIVVSGSWAKKAQSDLNLVGSANVIFDGADSAYTTLPSPESVIPSPGARYVQITSNETIGGLQWKSFPNTGSVPLVVDMSSDILSRKVDMGQFGLVFAGAQKNLGPAGVTLVIIRKELLEAGRKDLPAYLSYRTHAKTDSLYNTPPVFCIHALSLVMKWITGQGGMSAIEATNNKKAALLYGVINENPDFFRCPVDPANRSAMNAVFRLPNEEMEAEFIKGAIAEGMLGLKGHRSVGGIRVSMYNALPMQSVAALTDYMKSFATGHGV